MFGFISDLIIIRQIILAFFILISADCLKFSFAKVQFFSIFGMLFVNYSIQPKHDFNELDLSYPILFQIWRCLAEWHL
jgi:hypothetical protein